MVSDSQTREESKGRKYLQDLRTEKVKRLEDKELVQWQHGKHLVEQPVLAKRGKFQNS